MVGPLVRVRGRVRGRARGRASCFTVHIPNPNPNPNQVMAGNPAVLQCGPGLEVLGASEVKIFATLRSLGARIPAGAQKAVVFALVGAVLFPVPGYP